MNRTIDELLPERPETRLRIYSWSPNDPPTGYERLLKVGQTTKADVNARHTRCMWMSWLSGTTVRCFVTLMCGSV